MKFVPQIHLAYKLCCSLSIQQDKMKFSWLRENEILKMYQNKTPGGPAGCWLSVLGVVAVCGFITLQGFCLPE